MTPQEQFGRAFVTVRSTFGGVAAMQLWERAAAAVLDGGKKMGPDVLQAAFTETWADAGKGAETKKGKARGSVASAGLKHRPPATGTAGLELPAAPRALRRCLPRWRCLRPSPCAQP